MIGKNKKGLSPVVATVLLVAMVIVIALIIFLWIRGLTEETITKFGDQNVKIVCKDIYFEASYSNSNLYVKNTGNIPIFGMEVRVLGEGKHLTQDLRETTISWPEAGLNQGGVFSEVIDFDGNELILVPVLLGESKELKKTHVCDEEQYGFSISI